MLISTVTGRLMIMGRSGVGCHDVQNGVADFHGELRLGPGEALGAVLKQEVALVLLAQLLDELSAVNGDLL